MLEIELEEPADRLCLPVIDDKFPSGPIRMRIVAERGEPAHPEPLLLRGGDLVPDPLGRDLALELGKGQKHVQRQPSHGRRSVESLRDRHEGTFCCFKPFDQLREIRQRAGQTVDLVDDNHVDPSGVDVGEEVPEGGPFQRPAGDPAIVISGRHHLPALMSLAGDEGRTGLVLGVERVEVLVETVVRGLPRVNRAADRGLAHDGDFPLRPKKRGPDQWAPVISRAIAESDLQVSPFQ